MYDTLRNHYKINGKIPDMRICYEMSLARFYGFTALRNRLSNISYETFCSYMKRCDDEVEKLVDRVFGEGGIGIASYYALEGNVPIEAIARFHNLTPKEVKAEADAYAITLKEQDANAFEELDEFEAFKKLDYLLTCFFAFRSFLPAMQKGAFFALSECGGDVIEAFKRLRERTPEVFPDSYIWPFLGKKVVKKRIYFAAVPQADAASLNSETIARIYASAKGDSGKNYIVKYVVAEYRPFSKDEY